VAGLLAPSRLTERIAGPLRFALATDADDAELRALLRRSVVPGAVRVAFTREPRYRDGEALCGAVERTIIARADAQLVALGRCSVRSVHRNGVAGPIGYLSELRTLPAAPHGAQVLRDGYDFLRDMLHDVEMDGCVTSIATDNAHARRVLECGHRFGLPRYTFLADLVTLVVPAARAHHTASVAPLRVHVSEHDQLRDFLATRARDMQLSLLWDNSTWESLRHHGITESDFCVVRRAGRIVGAAALWDQRAFRQIVIDGYHGALQWARPFLNVASAVTGMLALPAVGATLPQLPVLGLASADDAALLELWQALRADATASNATCVTVTRDARDPLLRTLQQVRGTRAYHTRLYDVRWRNQPAWRSAWRDEVLYAPEVALL
jgi:hypothetical protein